MNQRKFLQNLIPIIFLFFSSSISAQSPDKPGEPLNPVKLNLYSPWVDHTFKKMSRKRRIEQLFMVAAYSNKSQNFQDSVGEIIKKYQPGGIIFFQGGPVRQAQISNRYQDLLKVKAMVAMDAEWGLGMRLDSTQSFPYQMTLGAIRNDSLIREMGRVIGTQLKRLGVHVNFAPVLDVNNNINNSVINFRSFGEDKIKVSQKASQYILGLQDMGILATGKHFPGHGDTEVDSHSDLPVLPFPRARLDSLELYPFRQAIALGIGGMMVAHMNIRALDTAKHLPSTLSGNVVQKVLKDELGFKGLVFTDAMNMKGVLKYYPAGEAETKAIIAGNDMVEMSTDLKKSIKGVKKAIRKGMVSRDEINMRCRKVLAWKEWMGLADYKPIPIQNLYSDLHSVKDNQLNINLLQESLTLLKYEDSIGRDAHTVFSKKGALISINPPERNVLLDNTLLEMIPQKKEMFKISKDLDSIHMDSLERRIKEYDFIFLVIHDKRIRPGSNLGLSPAVTKFISKLCLNPNAYITVLANPYTLSKIENIEKAKHLLLFYQESLDTEQISASFWQGNIGARGILPVTIPGKFNAGVGIQAGPIWKIPLVFKK